MSCAGGAQHDAHHHRLGARLRCVVRRVVLRGGRIMTQLALFDVNEQIASLEQTLIDIGIDVAHSLDERIAEAAALRARVGALETLCMDQCKVNSEHGDRLRAIEMRIGIRRAPVIPEHALERAVA